MKHRSADPRQRQRTNFTTQPPPPPPRPLSEQDHKLLNPAGERAQRSRRPFSFPKTSTFHSLPPSASIGAPPSPSSSAFIGVHRRLPRRRLRVSVSSCLRGKNP
jgi:hypothetical protein